VSKPPAQVLCTFVACRLLHRLTVPGSNTQQQQQQVVTPNEFLRAAKLDNVNLPDLLIRQHNDHLVFKVAGYADEVAGTAAAVAAAAQGPTTLAQAVRRQDAVPTVRTP
jgi:hypothetical protein